MVRWQHWRQRCYPVAYLDDLDQRRPTPFTLLGIDLVLWFEAASGLWRAFADVCPHRLVPLSQGRLSADGELECPYHGWRFNGEGRCTAIPQAEQGAQISGRRSGCRAYPTAEGQGLLFVFIGEPQRAEARPLPLVPALEEEPERWLLRDPFRDLPMDALTALENVLDVSHVPFTHHRTVGRRENAAPVRAELGEISPEGFSAVWAEGPRRGKLGSQHTTFLAPCLMWHDLTAKGFAQILTVVYATPTRRGECRLFARFPFQFASRRDHKPRPGLARGRLIDADHRGHGHRGVSSTQPVAKRIAYPTHATLPLRGLGGRDAISHGVMQDPRRQLPTIIGAAAHAVARSAPIGGRAWKTSASGSRWW